MPAWVQQMKLHDMGVELLAFQRNKVEAEEELKGLEGEEMVAKKDIIRLEERQAELKVVGFGWEEKSNLDLKFFCSHCGFVLENRNETHTQVQDARRVVMRQHLDHWSSHDGHGELGSIFPPFFRTAVPG